MDSIIEIQPDLPGAQGSLVVDVHHEIERLVEAVTERVVALHQHRLSNL